MEVYRQLRARRALMLFNAGVQLRTRMALSLQTLYSDMRLSGSQQNIIYFQKQNIINALLAFKNDDIMYFCNIHVCITTTTCCLILYIYRPIHISRIYTSNIWWFKWEYTFQEYIFVEYCTVISLWCTYRQIGLHTEITPCSNQRQPILIITKLGKTIIIYRYFTKK